MNLLSRNWSNASSHKADKKGMARVNTTRIIQMVVLCAATCLLAVGCTKGENSKDNSSMVMDSKSINPSAADLRPNQEYDLLSSEKPFFTDEDGEYSVKSNFFTWYKGKKLLLSKQINSSNKFLVISNSKYIFIFSREKTLITVEKKNKEINLIKITENDIFPKLFARYLYVIFDKLYFYYYNSIHYNGAGFDGKKLTLLGDFESLPIGKYKGNMIFPKANSSSSDSSYEILFLVDYKFFSKEIKFVFPERIDCGKIDYQFGIWKVKNNTIEIPRWSPCGKTIFTFDWLADPPKLIGYHFSK